MLLPILLLLALLSCMEASPLPHLLHPRQFSSPIYCNASSLSPPSVAPGNDSAGFQLQQGQQVVAVALARGVQNYTCTFSQQVESGVLAFLYDVTCLAVALPSNTTSNETSSSSTSATSAVSTATSSAASGSATTSSESSTPIASRIPPSSFSLDGIATVTSSAAAASLPTSLISLFPLDPLPLPAVQPDPSSPSSPSSSLGFNLSSLPSLALQIPFPFNASSFPYLNGRGPLGEWYYVLATQGEAEGTNVPFWAVPGLGSVTGREVNRTAAPAPMGGEGNSTMGGGGTDMDWTAYQAVDGGNGMFATTVWNVETAGGGLASQNCTGEGNTTSVDFASLVYFFR